MDKKTAAEILDGCEYREEGTPEFFEDMAKSGLVAVFGASDDLTEFRGAIDDEIGSYGGGSIPFNENGLIVSDCDCEDCPYFYEKLAAAKKIKAIWGEGDASWQFSVPVEHETFKVMEDGDVYCIGVVFSLADMARD